MKSDLKIAIGVAMTVAIVAFLVQGGTYLGFSAEFTEDFVYVLPGLILFVVGAFILVTQGRSSYALPGFAILGIGLALLAGYLEDVQILVTTQIEEIQLAIVGFCLMLGGVIFAAGN